MRVLLIDAGEKTITTAEVSDGLAGIRRLIGFESVDSDEIGSGGDRLYFDESCFIRQLPNAGRFRLDTLAPVAGRGVVAGSRPGQDEPSEPAMTLEALRTRVAFL